MLRSGDMRYEFAIQTNTPTRDASGSLVDSWADTHTAVRAMRMPARGREGVGDSQVFSEQSVDWVIRWRAGVVPSMRIVWADPSNSRTRYFEIHAVEENRPENVLMLQTREIQE